MISCFDFVGGEKFDAAIPRQLLNVVNNNF